MIKPLEHPSSSIENQHRMKTNKRSSVGRRSTAAVNMSLSPTAQNLVFALQESEELLASVNELDR